MKYCGDLGVHNMFEDSLGEQHSFLFILPQICMSKLQHDCTIRVGGENVLHVGRWAMN